MNSSFQEVYELALGYFEDDKFSSAEPLLNQLIIKGCKKPYVFFMLGAIYHEKGSFKKSIRCYKRCLQIDPSFTDASVGLSVLLNDLGRYEEGQSVFDNAKTFYDTKSRKDQRLANEKLSQKHHETGDLYFKYERYKEALDEFFKAERLSSHRHPELTLTISECYVRLDNNQRALMTLSGFLKLSPKNVSVRMRLAKLNWINGHKQRALHEWKNILKIQPDHPIAKKYVNDFNFIQLEDQL